MNIDYILEQTNKHNATLSLEKPYTVETTHLFTGGDVHFYITVHSTEGQSLRTEIAFGAEEKYSMVEEEVISKLNNTANLMLDTTL